MLQESPASPQLKHCTTDSSRFTLMLARVSEWKMQV